uniref:Sperm acrosome associated 1 n=1 Tax=Strix occidentalis caurina TaxID=311401 RepID=A0A8D0FLM7_STROC
MLLEKWQNLQCLLGLNILFVYIILTSRIKKEKAKQSMKERKKCRVKYFHHCPCPPLPQRICLQEVLLTSGCPGTEGKCVVHVEECRGPVDCGCKWNTGGIPISEGLACVKMPCIYIPPENRFKYVWKMFIPNKTAHILPNDSAIMKVCSDTHSVTFQCGTQENGNIIASVKCRVYAKNETGQSRRTTTGAILVFCLVTGIIVTIGVILFLYSLIFVLPVEKTGTSFWRLERSTLQSSYGDCGWEGNESEQYK